MAGSQLAMEVMAERPRTAGWPLLRVTPSSANQVAKALPPPSVTDCGELAFELEQLEHAGREVWASSAGV